MWLTLVVTNHKSRLCIPNLRLLLLEAYDQLERDTGKEVDIALRRQSKHTQGLEVRRCRLTSG